MRKKVEQILIALDYLVDVVIDDEEPYGETFEEKRSIVSKSIYELLDKEFFSLPESRYKAFMQLKTLDILLREGWKIVKRIYDVADSDKSKFTNLNFSDVFNSCNTIYFYLEGERNNIISLLSEEERDEYQQRQTQKLIEIDEANENEIELKRMVGLDKARAILGYKENGECDFDLLKEWFVENKAEFVNKSKSALWRVLKNMGLVKVERRQFARWFE